MSGDEKKLILPSVLTVLFAALTAAFVLSQHNMPTHAETVVKNVEPPRQYDYMKPSWARDVEPDMADLGVNLALNKPATADNFTDVYKAANATDGDPKTYWEGKRGTYPHKLTVDLGENVAVKTVRIVLPALRIWTYREMTFSILVGAEEDGDMIAAVPETMYPFDPLTGNFVDVNLPSGTTARFVSIEFTGNTSGFGGQTAELEVY